MTKEILIAEDDPVLRDVYIKKFGASPDFVIRTAANGEEALKLIAEKKPDILLLDINMPVLDGFGVLQKLPKADRQFPVIILTNFEDQQNRRRGEELGVDDYFIKKEMTIKSLYEMVEKLLAPKN
jgi:DNA-binding response OmpR family regulator